ncbi:MAG: hypothetical protein NT139_02210 [Candidatus Woesearchaeota archaeon]|nr:hypothetical protein [Candidatus Woesearchaeota archaeon]
MKNINKKESRIKKLILPFILVFLMVGSVFTVILSGSSNENEVKYNNLKFTKTNEGWISYINDRKVVLFNNPKDLENMSISNINLQDLNSAQKIYLSINPDENIQQAYTLFNTNIKPLLRTILVNSCNIDNEKCANLPLKTCTDASQLQKVIILEESNSTKIEYNNNCLYISGNQEDLTKIIDKLTLNLLGV